VTIEGQTLNAGKEVWITYAEQEKNTERLIKKLGAAHTILQREKHE
jgi:hypothetical protein